MPSLAVTATDRILADDIDDTDDNGTLPDMEATRRHSANRLRHGVGWLLAVAACVSGHTQPATQLFDGTLAGWTIENTAAGNIALNGGLLRVGAAPGWLRSAGRHADFTLRIEFRFLSDNADSGIFVRARAERTFGPGWPNDAYQVQLRNPAGESRFPPVGGIFRHGLPDGDIVFDPSDAARLSLGTGVWQTLQIEAIGATLNVQLNGEQLSRATGIVNPTGYIGIQAETGELEFRKIEIEPL